MNQTTDAEPSSALCEFADTVADYLQCLTMELCHNDEEIASAIHFSLGEADHKYLFDNIFYAEAFFEYVMKKLFQQIYQQYVAITGTRLHEHKVDADKNFLKHFYLCQVIAMQEIISSQCPKLTRLQVDKFVGELFQEIRKIDKPKQKHQHFVDRIERLANIQNNTE